MKIISKLGSISCLLLALLAGNSNAAIVGYAINNNGDIIASTSDVRFYGDNNGYWILDEASNSVRPVTSGVFSPLNTTLFTVADIADVTWTDQFNHMWVTVTGSDTRYAINNNGDIIGSTSDVRFYGDHNGYWILDEVNNSVRPATSGVSSPLNTTLFTVADILDVTWVDQFSHMWVLVDDSPGRVSEPSLFALFSMGLIGLVVARRRSA